MTGKVIRTATAILAIATALPAGAADKVEKIPLYLWSGQVPYRTVEAAGDEAYQPGDLVVVAGTWQRGGLAGGAVLHFTIAEPALGEDKVLTQAPVDVRYFYLDVLPPDAPENMADNSVEVRGLVADDDLYEYAYVVRPELLEVLAEPDVLGDARAALEAIIKDIKKVKLDLISGEVHREYNKNYKIVADVAEAELMLVGVDYEADVAVTRARLERLPPLDSDILFRYLDVYVFSDCKTCKALWAVACVGGYYLE
jgi:hypothetical protein